MKKTAPCPESSDPSDREADVCWSPGKRRLASLGILFFLFVIVIAPLSNPIGSASFSIPLAKAVAPIHQSLFLGHGYRFFGPDPGPSHLVYYSVTQKDGGKLEGHFPDREQNWPRLFYHRWFMLSETIYREHMFTPDQVGFEQGQQQLTKEILEFRNAGEFEIVKQLEQRRLEQEVQYQDARRRIDDLVNALAKHLLTVNGGESVQLFVRERLIAGPLDVVAEVPLDDNRYLSPPMPIGPGLEDMPAPPTTPPVGEVQPDQATSPKGSANREGLAQ